MRSWKGSTVADPWAPEWLAAAVLGLTLVGPAVSVGGGLVAATLRAFRSDPPVRAGCCALLVKLYPYAVGYFVSLRVPEPDRGCAARP